MPGDRDQLLVTSHDCDVLNASIAKEPLVEVLRARVLDDATGRRNPFSAGRNPRTLRLSEVSVQGEDIALGLVVQDRWEIPRELLMEEGPVDRLPPREGRLVAEWLAKRYIRSAFPTEFDRRWSVRTRGWRKLLKRHSEWMQGCLPPAQYPSRASCRRIIQVPSLVGRALVTVRATGVAGDQGNDRAGVLGVLAAAPG